MGAQRGQGQLRVGTARLDEMPAGVPAPSAAPEPARDESGRYRAGHPATRAAAAAAGRAKRDRTKLAHTLAVTTDDPGWRAQLRGADAFRAAQVRMLAQTVGGGQCGPAPAALVASAALALAASRLAYSRGDFVLGARLASEVRQNLLAAHELAAREAEARPLLGHAAPVATGTPSRRAELARRLALAPTAAASTSAPSTTENASTRQPDASAQEPQGDPEQ
jgi:hypothetical protein